MSIPVFMFSLLSIFFLCLMVSHLTVPCQIILPMTQLKCNSIPIFLYSCISKYFCIYFCFSIFLLILFFFPQIYQIVFFTLPQMVSCFFPFHLFRNLLISSLAFIFTLFHVCPPVHMFPPILAFSPSFWQLAPPIVSICSLVHLYSSLHVFTFFHV